MKHLITGGAGFIGTNYIRYILECYPDDEVFCADKLTYAGNFNNISGFMSDKRFRFERADICDREAVCKIVKEYGPDCIVNFAAESHVDRSVEDPEVFLTTNILGTSVLLDAVNSFGIKRFHQISTDEVYGDLPLERPDLKFDEGSPIKPSSPYSTSKAAADMLCTAYYRTYGTPITISRCSNNLGPYQFPEKLIPLFINNIRHRKPLPVYGKGENVRDWLFVEDHARAIDLIFHRGKVAETYNIGGFNEWKNIDIIKVLIRTVDRLLGRNEGEDMDLITYVTDRLGHDARYAIDSSKLQKELGWEPSLQFEEGIEKTVRWYLDNQEWMDNITSGEYEKYYEEMYSGK